MGKEFDVNSRYNEVCLIKDRLSNLKPSAILMAGSYGRGEGAFVEENGKIVPYNDYDIVVVTEDNFSRQFISQKEKELSHIIGVRWVDIDTLTKKQLSNLPPSIYSFDLKYASTVIAGDINITNAIPAIDKRLLTLREAEKLFTTRLWTFLGSLDKNAFHKEIVGEEARFFRNQMAKAVLAVADSILVQQHSYTPFLSGKINAICSTETNDPRLLELVEWAIREKTSPNTDKIESIEVRALYEKVHNVYFSKMFYLLTDYYGYRMDTPLDIEWYWNRSPRAVIRKTKSFIKGNLKRYNYKLRLQLAQIFVACAYQNGKINQGYLEKGLVLLKSSANVDWQEVSAWDEVRLMLSKLIKD